jgi:O-antigen/teichoic acid export membrane protein
MLTKLQGLVSFGSGRIARNALWNIAGSCVPLMVAAVAIPQLIKRLGADRFGFLTIVWVIIGYFSLFDFGLGRALTNLVARFLGDGRENEVPALTCTATTLMLGMGLTGALALAAAAPVLVHRVLNMPLWLQPDGLFSLWAVSISIPIVIVTTGLRGVVEAYQRFDWSNIARIPQGIFNFAGPLVMAQFSASLFPIVLVLLAGRVALLIAYGVMAYRLLPKTRSGRLFQTETIHGLLSFGGWMTVSAIISPVMASLDRFLIGTLMTMQAVAFYSTPNEVVTKLLLLPAGLAGVMFPTFSTMLVSDPAEANRLYSRSVKYLIVALLPPIVAIVLFGHFGLRIWLGADFASHSTLALQILSFGVLANGLAHVPFALIQGAGKPEWTGKLHLLELPIYLALFYPLVRSFGITGAAVAWSGRMVVDAGVLFALARRVRMERITEADIDFLEASAPAALN